MAYTPALGGKFCSLDFFMHLQSESVNLYQSVSLKVTKISRHYQFIQHCLWPTLREEMFYHGWPTKLSELDTNTVLWRFAVTQRGVDVPHNWTATEFYTVGWSVTINAVLLWLQWVIFVMIKNELHNLHLKSDCFVLSICALAIPLFCISTYTIEL